MSWATSWSFGVYQAIKCRAWRLSAWGASLVGSGRTNTPRNLGGDSVHSSCMLSLQLTIFSTVIADEFNRCACAPCSGNGRIDRRTPHHRTSRRCRTGSNRPRRECDRRCIPSRQSDGNRPPNRHRSSGAHRPLPSRLSPEWYRCRRRASNWRDRCRERRWPVFFINICSPSTGAMRESMAQSSGLL